MRAAWLRGIGEAALDTFLRAQLGQRRRALLERHGTGHTDHFAPVRIAPGSPVPVAGAVAELAIHGVENGMLVGYADR